MAIIMVSASDLRRAYLPGRLKVGAAAVASIGITSGGVPVTRIVFGRHGRIELHNGPDHFATYQDTAAIDD
jgi:hypothetical protein